jgi:chromatin segregation and condensation protein Rec8/ScpA/Scc1 (kleisin family)
VVYTKMLTPTDQEEEEEEEEEEERRKQWMNERKEIQSSKGCHIH